MVHKMGNSASDIISKVASSTTEDLLKQLNQDIEILQDRSLMYTPSKLAIRPELAKYSVPYPEIKVEKKDQIATDDEQSLVISQSLSGSSKERREQVLNNLTINISRNKEPDLASEEFTKRLQAFCRVFEAILRLSELKCRKESQGKEDLNDSVLPPTAKSAIKFGLNTLLSLIECVAVMSPGIYDMVIKDTMNILQEIGPLSMVTGDTTLVSAFVDIFKFFEGVVSGSIESIPVEKRLSSVGIMLRLALATGNTDLFVISAIKLMGQGKLHEGFLSEFLPVLKDLNGIKTKNLMLFWNRKAEKVTLNEDKTVVKLNENTQSNVIGGFNFITDKFYAEVKVKALNEGCYFGVCEPEFSAMNTYCASNFSACYKATGELYLKNVSKSKGEPWKVGDSIGVFVDMVNKKCEFYKNNVKIPESQFEFTNEALTIYMSLFGQCEFEINTQFPLPEDLQKAFEYEKVSPSIKDLIEFEEKRAEYFEVAGQDLGLFIFEKLQELVHPFEYILKSPFRFERSRPLLGVNFTPNTIYSLYEAEQTLATLLKSGDFSVISKETLEKSLTIVLQLLYFHLRLAKDLNDQSLNFDLKQNILKLTSGILSDLPDSPITHLAAQIISSSFEVFYKGSKEKMDYIIDSLLKIKSKKTNLPIFAEMDFNIFSEMARADKIFPALGINTESDEIKIQDFYSVLIELAEEASINSIRLEEFNPAILKLFESVQSAILAQSAKVLFKDKWEAILKHYIESYLKACERICEFILKKFGGELIHEDTLKAVAETIVARPLQSLLDSVILSTLSLNLVSIVLPVVTKIFQTIAGIQAPPSRFIHGFGLVESVYESPHNYADNSNLTHTIEIPGATKYLLTFDPQCKTENGCDYLELFLDKTASNKFARWEGESFPKEQVEVNNPLLHFTFRSDGSVNYWGWKISIKAVVNSSYQEQVWPDTLKQTIESFFGICASKLIAGGFSTTEVDPEIQKLLKNPLFKYGISDKCSLLKVPPSPIDPDLSRIISCFLEAPNTNIPESLRKFYFGQDKESSLGSYLETYSSLAPQLPESNFLSHLFEGPEAITTAWAALKKKCGIIGPASSIGGKDLDSAERAVFAVYTGFFEIVETMKNIFSQVNDAGPTVKMIVKQSCNIRVWAQKHKQQLMDSGKTEITYKVIADDIVKKCWFLLGTGYQESLQDIGISTVMKNLLSNIAKTEKKGLKVGSKWKTVQTAVKNVSKLKGLVSLKKSQAESQNEDTKEFSRVAELVTGFLEQQITLDKIVEALQVNRLKGVSRALGLLAISNLLTSSPEKLNTFLLNSFNRAFSKSEEKLHYSELLEGIDHNLTAVIQESYFKVFKNLTQSLVQFHYKEFDYQTYIHFLTVIEGLSIPLHSQDTHLLRNQPILAGLKVLLDWSKGLICQKPAVLKFQKENCITRFGVLEQAVVPESQGKVLIEKKEEQPSVYLVYDKGGDELPISEYKLCEEETQIEGFEDAIGKFAFNGADRWILIKREEVNENGKFLTGVDNDLNPIFSSYGQLLGKPNQTQVDMLVKLKEKLSQKSWDLYKKIVFFLLGENENKNKAQNLEVQEALLKVILSELGKFSEESEFDKQNFSLKALSTGEEWVGKYNFSFNKPTLSENWLRKFASSGAPVELVVIIRSFFAHLDPLVTGTGQFELASIEDQETLIPNLSSPDFLAYIESISSQPDLPVHLQEYFKSLSQISEYTYTDPLNPESILSVLETLIVPAPENSFTEIIKLFKGSNGSLPKAKVPDSIPSEFKDPSEALDLFITLNAVQSLERFFAYKQELFHFFKAFPELPSNVTATKTLKLSDRGYVSSLLWILYGAFFQYDSSNTLASSENLQILLKFAFKSSAIVLQTLSLRILSKIIPSQHSPQSFLLVWNEFLPSLPKNSQLDVCDLLLRNTGKTVWDPEERNLSYESQNLLTSLIASDRWRDTVLHKIQENLLEISEFLNNSKTLKATHAGTLKFLSFAEGPAVSPFVLAVVSLKDCNFSAGVIKAVIDDKNFSVYSIIDDSSVNVEVSKITNLLPGHKLELKSWFGDSIKSIFQNLVQILAAFEQARNFPLQSLEAGATLRTHYVALESTVLTVLERMLSLAELQEEDVKYLSGFLIRTPRVGSDVKKSSYLRVASEIQNRLKDLCTDKAEFTLDEVKSKVEGYSEEDKTKYNEVIERGIGELWAFNCFSKGIKDYESILAYEEPVPVNQIYNLSLLEESLVQTSDIHGSGELYQNYNSHIVIKDSNDSLKTFTFKLPERIFKDSKYFISEVTIRLAISGSENSVFGISIGSLTASVDSDTLQIASSSFKISPTKSNILRINAKSTGHVKITLENTDESLEIQNNFVFNGILIEKFSLFLKQGNFVTLPLLQVFDGPITEKFSDKVQVASKQEGGERALRVKKTYENLDKSRLRLLGISESDAESSLKHSSSLREAVNYSFNHFEPTISPSSFGLPDLAISEIGVYDDLSKVPAGFTPVPVYENLAKTSDTLQNSKILAFKTIELQKDSKVVVDLWVVENSGGELIGNLTIPENERPNEVFAKTETVTTKTYPIRDIIFLRTSSVYNLKVPANYELITDKEEKVINIAGKQEKEYIFVAVNKTLSLLGGTYYPLEKVPVQISDYGLCEAYADSSVKEDSTDLSTLSIMELFQLKFNYEQILRTQTAKSLSSNLLSNYPSLLKALFEEHPLKTIINLVPWKDLCKFLQASEDISQEIIADAVSLLLEYQITKPGGRVLRPVVVESKHPYDNSTDLDEVIQIPGARGLKIEFDPQCNTESSCDTLRFYENPGRQNEIKVFSGTAESNWTSFEVPGNTVHIYFHSDGSVSYWGYKFTVSATNSARSNSTEDIDSSVLLDLIGILVQKSKNLSILNSKRLLVPLNVFLLTCQLNDEKVKVLEIMKNLFSGELTDMHVEILKGFVKTGTKLYQLTKADKKSHSILQAILILIIRAYRSGQLTIDEAWFLDLSDFLSDMGGLAYKNELLDLFLFESFKSQSKAQTELELQSEHPYKISTNSQLVQIKGAHSLSLEFNKDSKSEDHHTIYISKDEQGEQDAQNDTLNNALVVTWDDKGPDVVIDNESKRVTRTSSSSWGAAVSKLILKKNVFSVTLLVENCDASGYMYLGFVEYDGNDANDLTMCFNSGCPKRVWTWKQSGEFHEKGSDTGSVPYVAGDILTFIVNFSQRTIICQKNSIEVWTFRNISESLLLGASFGGSNQFVVIKSAERTGGSKIEDMSLTLLGDTAYLWFPVNVSAKLQYYWDVVSDENLNLTENRLGLVKKGENVTVAPLVNQIVAGRYFAQAQWGKGKVGFGVGPHSSVIEKEVNETWVLSQLEGFTEGELVGCLVDVGANLVQFYRGNEVVSTLEGRLGPGPYRFVAIFYDVESSLTVVPGKPAGLDLLRIHSDQVSSEFGYKVKVKPLYKGRFESSIQSYLSSSSEEVRTSWLQFRDQYSSAFKSQAAEELITYIDRYSASKGKDPLSLTQEEVDPTEPELIYYPSLEKLSKDSIKSLFAILQEFNKRVEDYLFLFDLNITENLTEMQKVLLGSRNFIFFSCKNAMLKKVLDKSKSDIVTEITIDRPKAARHRNKKEVDTDAQFSITGQIFRALSGVVNKGFRNGERIYKINYRGEASIDAGGPYNESMSNICDELQSTFLRLFVPTANHVHNLGENREAWTINPSATSQVELDLYKFIGKLMGAAIRTQNNLNLSLAPIIWKQIIYENLTIADLRGIDVCTVQILEMLRDPENHELTPDNFEMAFDEKFTTKDSSGRDIELIPGGKDVQVTYKNCSEYADLVLNARLNENTRVIQKLREGISAVIQIDLLNLFSWRQVETLVCGTVDVNVDILKENTDYEGCGLSDQHIQYFWEVLKEFSQLERSLYLKFVWGRSRLPSGKEWRHMKVTRYNPSGPVNNYLPVSHTCFFTLDLPAYTTKEAMRQKLLYAVTHCTAIDLDGSAGAGWEDHD